MRSPGARAREVAAIPRLRRMVKFGTVSAIAVVISQTVIAVCFGLLHWSAPVSNVTAVAVSTGPSFLLNRRWTWRQSGPSHFRREVVPFWVMAFVGLVLSTVAAGLAEDVAERVTDRRALQTVLVMAAALTTYGVLWLAKFLVLDHLVWGADAPDGPEAGRGGEP